MHFLKAGLLFAASTISRLLAGLLVVKLIAVYIGADGLGRLGQFMSLMSMITMMAGGGIGSGVIKYVAQSQDDRQELLDYLGVASAITLCASFVLGSVLLFGAGAISQWLFKSAQYAYVIKFLAVAQFAVAATNLLMGVVNGHRRVVAFAIINGAGVVLGAAGVAFGSMYYGIEGAMFGLMAMPACYIVFLLPWYRFGLRFEWRVLRPRWNMQKMRQYMGFSLMLLTSVLTMQMAQVVIRNIIEQRDSWVGVGYWQATTKISDAYLMFITVVLANYYLPRLAALKTRLEIRNEVAQVYTLALPVLVVMALAVYFCRDWIIILLFSKEFSPMRSFFTWQLVGDAFKVAAYIGGYVAVARASTRLYIAAELVQSGMLVGLCYLFVGRYGAVGATYAYCLCYIIYFAMVQTGLRVYLRKGGNA